MEIFEVLMIIFKSFLITTNLVISFNATLSFFFFSF